MSSLTDTDTKQPAFLKFVAYLQVIGIVLVVLGHSFHEYPDGKLGYTLLLCRMLGSFRMPLFMFVSGFLMVYTTFNRDSAPSVAGFARKKVMRLMLPYLVLAVVTYFPRVILSPIADDEMSLGLLDFIKAIFLANHTPNPFLWFLQASFLLLIFTYAYLYACRRLRLPKVMAYSVLILLFLTYRYAPVEHFPLWILGKISELGIFFVLGACYCGFYPHIDKYLALNNWWWLTATGAAWATTFLCWEGTRLATIYSLFGIMMCISAAKLLVRYRVTILDHLVGANYMIFLLSWFFNVLAQQVLSHFVVLPWWVYTALSLLLGIYIPWLGYVYLRSHQHSKPARVVSLLLGQSFKSKLRKGKGQ